METANIYQKYPRGWFALGFTDDIKPGQKVSKKLMGKELILWRSQQGKLSLQDAYCPHLGAHLGHCGHVTGERVRCSFHGIAYDEKGNSSLPLRHMGGSTENIRLNTYAVVEQNGIIFSNFLSPLALAAESKWNIDPIDTSHCTSPRRVKFDLHSTPHEITENTLDLLHFSVLHHYQNSSVEYESKDDYLQVKAYLKRSGDLFGRKELVQINTLTHHYGLGYANVHIRVVDLDLDFIGFVLPTPVDHHHIELRFQLQMKKITSGKSIHPLLGLIPSSWLTRLIFWQSFRGFVQNVGEDLPIWQHKRYLPTPALSHLDGPIPYYRHWAEQFY